MVDLSFLHSDFFAFVQLRWDLTKSFIGYGKVVNDRQLSYLDFEIIEIWMELSLDLQHGPIIATW